MMKENSQEAVTKLIARVDGLLEDRDASRARRAETIGELRVIVSSIDRIAMTMKRLAINATIESARAGNDARGFAVIAGEMKGLANAMQDAVQRATALLDARANDQNVA